ncbi:sulfur carrier protein ThiS [Anaerococcus sp.]|uniref:sulfur carrier protein ThiS n=1 Tax=Anaerococcus sp. TaxID=1872515 RepID=UPI00280B6FB8|nr:sulfur carrier protein ThiS [Anaerococcus sp.]MDU3177397.1 sulfur carrier protein ThiS [Anaerococcus sp.]
MIKVNAKELSFVENESLYDLLERANFNPDFVAVEVDEELVKRENYKDYFLQDGSKVEVFSFVGGG